MPEKVLFVKNQQLTFGVFNVMSTHGHWMHRRSAVDFRKTVLFSSFSYFVPSFLAKRLLVSAAQSLSLSLSLSPCWWDKKLGIFRFPVFLAQMSNIPTVYLNVLWMTLEFVFPMFTLKSLSPGRAWSRLCQVSPLSPTPWRNISVLK